MLIPINGEIHRFLNVFGFLCLKFTNEPKKEPTQRPSSARTRSPLGRTRSAV